MFFAISLTGLVIGQSTSFLPDYSKAVNAAGLIFKILDLVPAIDVFSKRGQYPVSFITKDCPCNILYIFSAVKK